MKVALVGRTNVGKSTLFNRLVGRKHSIVSPRPGQTRDIITGIMTWNSKNIEVMDTGGYLDESPLASLVLESMIDAAAKADVVVLVIETKSGITGFDRELAERIRVLRKPVIIAVNKVDNPFEGAEAEGPRHRG